MHMKKTIGVAFAVLGLVLSGCHAQVRVEAKTAEPPPPEPVKVAEPTPVEPKAGEAIALPDQIEFETNQAKIKATPKTVKTLDALADVLKTHPNVTKLRIEGHTDDRGSTKHNDKLSKARADAVAKWLAQHEVDQKRLVTVGYGARKPLKPNDSDENRAQNRRTEYYFEEVDGRKIEGDTKTVESQAKNGMAGATASKTSAPN
jgi:outer membrane protein OmpA-like peptidoglycan-associated protein